VTNGYFVKKVKLIARSKQLTAFQISKRMQKLDPNPQNFISPAQVRQVMKKIGWTYFKANNVCIVKLHHFDWRVDWSSYIGFKMSFSYPGKNNQHACWWFFDYASEVDANSNRKNIGMYAPNKKKSVEWGNTLIKKKSGSNYICGSITHHGLFPRNRPIYIKEVIAKLKRKKEFMPRNKGGEGKKISTRSHWFYVHIFENYIFPDMRRLVEETGKSFIFFSDNQNSHRHEPTTGGFSALQYVKELLNSIGCSHVDCHNWSQILAIANKKKPDIHCWGKLCAPVGDFSAIEEVWGGLNGKLQKVLYKSYASEKRAVDTIWNSYTVEDCQRIMRRFPKKLQLIKKFGGRALTNFDTKGI
jgi:hypothetical protein